MRSTHHYIKRLVEPSDCHSLSAGPTGVALRAVLCARMPSHPAMTIRNESGILKDEVLPYEIQHQTDKINKTLSSFSMVSVEKQHIQKVMNYTRGNKAETARLLAIGVATLYRKLDEYNIQ